MAVRSQFYDRRALIEAALKGASPQWIERAITVMFTGFPATAQIKDDDTRRALYVEKLRPYPAWAIARAINEYRGDFAPACNRLVEACDKIITPTAVELAQLNRILAAEIVQQKEDRTAEKRAELAKELVAKVRAGADVEKSVLQPEPPQGVSMEGVKISDSAKASLGLEG